MAAAFLLDKTFLQLNNYAASKLHQYYSEHEGGADEHARATRRRRSKPIKLRSRRRCRSLEPRIVSRAEPLIAQTGSGVESLVEFFPFFDEDQNDENLETNHPTTRAPMVPSESHLDVTLLADSKDIKGEGELNEQWDGDVVALA